jgi:hypothetical protein
MSKTEKPLPDELHLVRDVLDKLLVDRSHEPLGRADGVVLVMNDNGQPRVARVQVGTTILASRLGERIGRWARKLGARFGLRGGQPVRFAWSKVQSTGIEIVIDTDADRSPAHAWERWIRQHITRHIPSLHRK